MAEETAPWDEPEAKPAEPAKPAESAPQPGFADPLSGAPLPSPGKPAEVAPWDQPERAWSDVPLQAIQNLPSSAWGFGRNVAQPFIHPIETAKSLGELGGGVLQHLNLMPGTEYQPAADAVGKFLMDRYGSIDAIKNTLATDPVGLAADVSMVLTGGGFGAARLPGIVGRVGEIAGEAGRLVNPLTAAGAAVAPVARGAGRLAAEAAGVQTHVGSEPFLQAARAGREGGEAAQAFREHLTGVAPITEPVVDAQTVLGNLRKERGTAYREAMDKLGKDYNQPLNFDKIDDALAESTKVHTYKGVPLDPPNVGKLREQMAQAIQEWKSLDPAQYHTPEGLDALKKKIGGIRDSTEYGTPERVAADKIYNGLRQTIINEAPEYAKIMRGYEQASTRLEELQKELSVPTPDSGRVDTALRKLQSSLRDNVNTSFGRRKELAQFLVDNGAPNLMYKLAGQSLQPWAPRGLGRLSMTLGPEMLAALGAGGFGTGLIGPAVAAAVTSSPRLMGEAAYWGGAGARQLGRAAPYTPSRAFAPGAAAVGRVPYIEQRVPFAQTSQADATQQPGVYAKGGRVAKALAARAKSEREAASARMREAGERFRKARADDRTPRKRQASEIRPTRWAEPPAEWADWQKGRK